MGSLLFSNRWDGPLPGRVLLAGVIFVSLFAHLCLRVLMLPLGVRR